MHVNLDHENDSVKQFVLSLPIQSESVELELEGRVICKVVPPVDEMGSQTLVERGRELVRRARERNRDVSAREIEREVREVVGDVRGQKSR